MDQYRLVAATAGDRPGAFASLKNGNDAVALEADADASSLKGSDSGEGAGKGEMTRSLRALLGRYNAEQQQAAGPGVEWREIARVLDRFLFFVFVILFMLVSISLLG
jgi:hypothetical protein